MFSFIIDIFIGFEQERYTVFEADAIGDLTSIPIIKVNNQQSELQFFVSVLCLGDTAERGIDFTTAPSSSIIAYYFPADVQLIRFQFVLLGDRLPEDEERFSIELTAFDAPRVMIGGGLFSRAHVVIIDDDG